MKIKEDQFSINFFPSKKNNIKRQYGNRERGEDILREKIKTKIKRKKKNSENLRIRYAIFFKFLFCLLFSFHFSLLFLSYYYFIAIDKA